MLSSPSGLTCDFEDNLLYKESLRISQANVRSTMIQYWEAHSRHASHAEVSLDSQGETLIQMELPEILDMLPDYRGKDVLELGAGIG